MLISKSLPKFWLKNVEEIGLSCHIVTKINTQQQSPGSSYSPSPSSPDHLVNTSLSLLSSPTLSSPGKPNIAQQKKVYRLSASYFLNSGVTTLVFTHPFPFFKEKHSMTKIFFYNFMRPCRYNKVQVSDIRCISSKILNKAQY